MISGNLIVMDNTLRENLVTCPRKFYFMEILGMKPTVGSSALRFGITWHAMVEGFFKYVKENGWESPGLAMAQAIEFGKKAWDEECEHQTFIDDYRTFNTCCEAFARYMDYFAHDATYVEIISTEQVFECQLTLDTEEEKRIFGHLPPILFTGKIDRQLKLSGSPWIADEKTTGFNADQVCFEKQRSPQFMGYTYASKKVLSYKTEGCLMSLCYVSSRKKKDGEYGSLSIDFRRVPFVYTDNAVEEWKRSFLDSCKEVFDRWLTFNWPKRLDSCMNYGKTCGYAPMCDQNCPLEMVNTQGFYHAPWDVRKTLD